MSALSQLTLKRLLRSSVIIHRTVYSGPENLVDYSKINFPQTRKDWEDEKFCNMRQRVIDLQNGKKWSNNTEKIVDENARKIASLPYNITSKCSDHMKISETMQKILGKGVESNPVVFPKENNLDPDFARSEIQQLLVKLRGFDSNKVFSTQIGKYKEMPRIRLLTTAELNQKIEESLSKVDDLLEMPPVMLERKVIDEVLAVDLDLDSYEDSKLVFTDISLNLKSNERFVVVRECDGVLRKAVWEERDRAMQCYYPKPERNLRTSKLFDNFQIAFDSGIHENVLEQILVEFNPDSAEFIKYTRQVYDDIEQRGCYDLLRSTRFFGGFVFYLAKYKSIDGLLSDTISRRGFSESADLVRLFVLLHQESKTSQTMKSNTKGDDLVIVETYVENDAKNRKTLQINIEACKMSTNEQHAASS